MKAMPAAGVDAVVTDPPYGLQFCGEAWDKRVPGEAYWREMLRVAKPGAHLLAFGGTRTWHRLAVAIEDAGWEIRDCLVWLHGQGFPKSLDVSKALDKSVGAKRTVAGRRQYANGTFTRDTAVLGWYGRGSEATGNHRVTLPVTDAAKQWDGWGTALKPAWEPIILARKPLVGTVAANVMEYGCGGLNIDGCRIGKGLGISREGEAAAKRRYTNRGNTNFSALPGPRGGDARGRWPANVVLDAAAGESLDIQAGVRKSGARKAGVRKGLGYHQGAKGDGGPAIEASAGGPSRFFYCAKACRSEVGKDNGHPTVKPLALMRWLVRLVVLDGGIVLDPFMGSGSTGIACKLEGMGFAGIDKVPSYVDLAKARIARAR